MNMAAVCISKVSKLGANSATLCCGHRVFMPMVTKADMIRCVQCSSKKNLDVHIKKTDDYPSVSRSIIDGVSSGRDIQKVSRFAETIKDIQAPNLSESLELDLLLWNYVE